MSSLDKYDSVSERLPDDSTPEERLNKFAAIFVGLESNNITIANVSPHTVDVVDTSCDFSMSHAINSWHIFRVVDVVDMIVSARDNHLKRKK